MALLIVYAGYIDGGGFDGGLDGPCIGPGAFERDFPEATSLSGETRFLPPHVRCTAELPNGETRVRELPGDGYWVAAVATVLAAIMVPAPFLAAASQRTSRSGGYSP